MDRHVLPCIGLVLVLACSSVHAIPPPWSIEEMKAGADLVVIARTNTASHVTDAGRFNRKIGIVPLHVLKGELPQRVRKPAAAELYLLYFVPEPPKGDGPVPRRVGGVGNPEPGDREPALIFLQKYGQKEDHFTVRGGSFGYISLAKTAESDLAAVAKRISHYRKWCERIKDTRVREAMNGYYQKALAFAKRRRPRTKPGKPGQEPKIPVPRGWTSEKRRVKVATPQGETLKEITYYKNTMGMEFVLIPAGEFMMGSDNGSDYEKPVHRVRITKPFYMDAYEVTQKAYQAVIGSNPSRLKGAKNPVESVSWNDALEFCKCLSQREGVTYRLPTEAEWEYACRAGTTTPFYFGNTISTDQANYNGSYVYGNGRKGVYREKAMPVGSFPPNALGLYDMHGNVWEWCQDWYDSGYYGKSPTDDPSGPRAGSHRVHRGGCWYGNPGLCRSASRDRDAPGRRYGVLGFRLVRTE